MTAVYSSDLQRAIQTATPVAARHGLEVVTLRELREVNYGEWEGLSEKDCGERNPEILRKRNEDPELVAPPGGESYREMMDRFLPVVENLAARHRSENIVLVSHHGNLRLLMCHLMQVSVAQYRSFVMANGGLTALENRKGSLVIQSMNDTCHLREMSLSIQKLSRSD